MKKFAQLMLFVSMLIFVGFGFTSCNDNDSSGGTSHLKVKLTDSPGDYEAVYIEVLDVKIKSSDDTSENGWVSVGNITPGIYNLLDLTGGVTALLAENDVPSGYVNQIRLILGDDNSVVIDGVSHHLNTPSAEQSGLKLKLNQTLVANTAYTFILDFDLDESIVEAGGSGNYNLHPVLRISAEAVTGSITGKVEAGDYQVLASVAIPGTIVTAYADADGVFYLHGIPAGTYSVILTPDAASGFAPKTIENVIVVNEQTTDTGTTAFP